MEKQNSELKFEVGKKYKFADDRKESCGCEITGDDGVFVCVNVDIDGDCWTEDAIFDGIDGRGFVGAISKGHCVSTHYHLKSGEVVEVKE